MERFFAISFTHHSEIIAKVSNLEERLFYIKKTAENHWSKERMIDEIKGDLYHHQSSMPNNFAQNTYKTAEDVRRVLPSEDDLRKIIDQEF